MLRPNPQFFVYVYVYNTVMHLNVCNLCSSICIFDILMYLTLLLLVTCDIILMMMQVMTVIMTMIIMFKL